MFRITFFIYNLSLMIWTFILAAYVSLFVYGLCDNIRGPLFPDILKTFQVSDSVGSLMFVIVSLSAVFASHLCRTFLLLKFGHKKTLELSALGLSLSLIALALSPRFEIFLAASALFGLSFGVLGIVSNILVPMGASESLRSRLISGLHAIYALSSLVAPLVVSALAGFNLSWRGILGWVALIPCFVLIYVRRSAQNIWKHHVPLSHEERQTRKRKNFSAQIFFAFMLSSYVAAEVMVSSRLPLFVRRTFSNEIEVSSLYLTYFFVCLLFGRLLFAVLKVKHSIQVYLGLSLALSVACIVLGVHVHPAFLALTGFTMAPFYPLAMSLLSSRFHDDIDAAVTYTIFIQSIFLALMHFLIGALTQAFGIQNALLTGSAFLILSGALLLVFDRKFKSTS